MKKWQQQYNYRRIKDESGTILRNVIYIENVPVEVNEEVYRAYSSMSRREVYQDKRIADNRSVSLEKLVESNVPLELYTMEHSLSAEEIVVQEEMEYEYAGSLQKLRKAMSMLTKEEQSLIQAIYFEGRSERDLAHEYGISQPAIHKRRNRILKKLKFFYDS